MPKLHAEWVEDEPEFLPDGTLVLTDELADTLQLGQAELLADAESAIRWLAGEIVSITIEDSYEHAIEINNSEGQEIFKAALQAGAADIPSPVEVTQAIARAFEVGEDLS